MKLPVVHCPEKRYTEQGFTGISSGSISNGLKNDPTEINRNYIQEVKTEFGDITRLDMNLPSQTLSVDMHTFIGTQVGSSSSEKDLWL